MKILAQRPTHISAVATVLLTKTFHRERETERQRQRQTETHRKTEKRETKRAKDRNIETQRWGGGGGRKRVMGRDRQRQMMISQCQFVQRYNHPWKFRRLMRQRHTAKQTQTQR